ncbi:pirin family protein [Priestia sp. JV24]|uniref:pirin family protein n=1 Tax=Priestia TaxID=2800373 RepID=UPI0021D679B2|nr:MULTISPECIES: pirin family protein [Priestia]MCU7713155.1 pirin family protein [Priestia megaterium]MCW1048820.1 pirin family protein [Priestia sp. JV24]MED3810538.1 pirin family protein [Priestia megaterium]
MEVKIIHTSEQAKGEFDGGKIIEQKPIGFSGEGSVISRLGPLFYWAWGQAKGAGGIGEHPHQGFEVLTYILSGKGFHKDSLGNQSEVDAGGVQLMQTGSGMWHAEGSDGPAEMFQIWLEPYLNDAIKRTPNYSKYKNEEFPVIQGEGVTIKTILGTDSPINLITDAFMYDIEISNSSSYQLTLTPNRTIAGLAIRGDGGKIVQQELSFDKKDFIIIQSEKTETITIKPKGDSLRIVFIEIPTQVEYPLYPKDR